MSIYTAMRAGVSGLNAQSSAMAVISDNIANVNTVAYKRVATDFTAMINGQNLRTSYNAGGVVAAARRHVDQQGSLEQSRSNTDLAISGKGFFVVSANNSPLSSGGVAEFTRSGSFTADEDGFLVNAQGKVLQGWAAATDGTITASPTSLSALSPVNVADVGGLAAATEQISIDGNLNSDQTAFNNVPIPYAVGALATGAIAPHFSTTIEAFDSLGSPRTIGLGFLKTAANTWQVEVYARPPGDAPTNPGGRIAEGTITFTRSGAVASITGTAGAPVNVAWAPTLGVANQTITLNLEAGMTQLAQSNGIDSVVADGVPPGDLQDLVVDDNGFLTARFDNGRSLVLYQIPVATFLSPNELSAEQNGVYRSTLAAGAFTINSAGDGAAGSIRAGVLESSNVDLASEFTQMITTQRAYSASSKVISTADEMLEELIRIKR